MAPIEGFKDKFRECSERLEAELTSPSMRRDIAARFVVIWTLLTRIPLPQKWWPETMPPGNRVLTLAPAAGGLMGLLTGLVVTIAGFFGLAPLACAWAGAAFYFVIGWALHLDGWGDVWDGIGSGRSGDKLREVMKDSRLGSFGGASLVIAFGLWTSLLSSVAPCERLCACVTAAAAARFAENAAAYFGRYPWESGMAKGWVDDYTLYDLFSALAALVIFLPFAPVRLPVCAAAAGLTGFAAAKYMNERLGGTNGDVMGAVAVASEIISMAVWAI